MKEEYRELIRTFNQGDIALIKSLLDSESIEYFLQGENFNLVRPLAQAPIFMVKKDQFIQARDLIKDLDVSLGPDFHR